MRFQADGLLMLSILELLRCPEVFFSANASISERRRSTATMHRSELVCIFHYALFDYRSFYGLQFFSWLLNNVKIRYRCPVSDVLSSPYGEADQSLSSDTLSPLLRASRLDLRGVDSFPDVVGLLLNVTSFLPFFVGVEGPEEEEEAPLPRLFKIEGEELLEEGTADFGSRTFGGGGVRSS